MSLPASFFNSALSAEQILGGIKPSHAEPKPELAGKLLKYAPLAIKAKVANSIFNLGREDARLGPGGWLPGPTQIANTLSEHQLPYLPTVGRANPETDLGARASRALGNTGKGIWEALATLDFTKRQEAGIEGRRNIHARGLTSMFR